MRPVLVTAIAVILATTTPSAHPAPFSYLDVSIAPGELTGRLVVHAIDVAHDLGLPSPAEVADEATVRKHSGALAVLIGSRLVLVADGTPLRWIPGELRALPSQDAVEIRWRAAVSRPVGRVAIGGLLFPYDPNHQTFVNVYEASVLVHQEVLNRARTRLDFFTGTRQGRIAVLTSFVASGIHHIAAGPDHILFIVGLLLLGGSLPRLLAIVTAFTAGHSVTLALAALDLVSLPARIVEPAIALSIVYVGADNLLVGRTGRDVRPWVALSFGLIHGFGFAAVLRETGLPSQALALALLSFNLGVEIGQAAVVVAIAWILVAAHRRRPALARRLVVAGSVFVTIAGAFWFVERVW